MLLQVYMASLEPVHLVVEVSVAQLLADVVGRSCKGMSIHNQLRQPGMRLRDTCRYLVFVGDYKDGCRTHKLLRTLPFAQQAAALGCKEHTT